MGQLVQVYWIPLHVKANCDCTLLPNKARKNALAISVGAYYLAAFDSISYWSPSMFNMAALNGYMASFTP